MAAITSNFSTSPTIGRRSFKHHASSDNFKPSVDISMEMHTYPCNMRKLPMHLTTWWADAGQMIKVLYLAASRLPWFTYTDSSTGERRPLDFSRVTSFGLYHDSQMDEVRLTILYFSGKSPGVDQTGHARIGNEYITLKLKMDLKSKHRYRVATRLLSVGENTIETTTAIKKFMQDLYNVIIKVAKLQFPPTSYNILCMATPPRNTVYLTNPCWRCISHYTTPGAETGDPSCESHPRYIE